MLIRLCAALPLLAALGGCDLYRAATTSLPEKVNQAFPLREDLATARNGLMASLAEDSAAQKAVGEQLAQLLQVRALACSSGAALGRFDTVAAVRSKVGDGNCFREQDTRLAEWIGMRRVGIAMRLPPLVPPAALPARFALPHGNQPVDLLVAPAANVAALQSARGQFTVVAMPSGKTLSTVDLPGANTHASSLSPNGRILALASGHGGLKFHDAEAGHLLWSGEKYSQVVAWLPEVEATLVAEKGNPVLVDHRKTSADPVPVAISNMRWSARLPGADARLLVGGGPAVAMLGYSRTTDGALALEPLRQWRLNGAGVTSGRPILMADGKKLFYVAMNDLAWLDVESGEQGMWPTQSIAAHGYAKLSETQLLLDANNGTGWQRSPRILDIAKGTLVNAEQEQQGLLIPLTPRIGYARRAHAPAVSMATVATPVGEEQPVDKVLAEAALARELAKVQAVSAHATGDATMPALSAALPVPRPMLTRVPPDARVSVVGVYEAASGSHGHGQPRRAGTIRVTVAPGKAPLVLVLSSYEPVTWLVHDGGRPIAAILVSGYHASQVIGTKAEVHRIGSSYAYKAGSHELQRLKQEIARYVAAPVRDFQGTYTGKEFSVY